MYVVIMKTINQYRIAEWLGVKAATFSNILNGRRYPSRDEAQRLARVSGVAFEDWMLSDRNLLRKKIMIAYGLRSDNKQDAGEK